MRGSSSVIKRFTRLSLNLFCWHHPGLLLGYMKLSSVVAVVFLEFPVLRCGRQVIHHNIKTFLDLRVLCLIGGILS